MEVTKLRYLQCAFRCFKKLTSQLNIKTAFPILSDVTVIHMTKPRTILDSRLFKTLFQMFREVGWDVKLIINGEQEESRNKKLSPIKKQ